MQRRLVGHYRAAKTLLPSFLKNSGLMDSPIVQKGLPGISRQPDDEMLQQLGVNKIVLTLDDQTLNTYVLHVRVNRAYGIGSASATIEAFNLLRPHAVFLGIGLIEFDRAMKSFKVNDLLTANEIEPITRSSARSVYGPFIPLLQTCLIKKVPVHPIGLDTFSRHTMIAEALLRKPLEILPFYKNKVAGADEEMGCEFVNEMYRREAPHLFDAYIRNNIGYTGYNLHRKLREYSTGTCSEPLTAQIASSSRLTKNQVGFIKALERMSIREGLEDIKWTGKKATLPEQILNSDNFYRVDFMYECFRVAVENRYNILPLSFPKNSKTNILLVCFEDEQTELSEFLKHEFPILQPSTFTDDRFNKMRRIRMGSIAMGVALFLGVPLLGFLYLLLLGFRGWNVFFTQGRQVSVGGAELIEQWERESKLRKDNSSTNVLIDDASQENQSKVHKQPKYTRVGSSAFDIWSFYRNDERE